MLKSIDHNMIQRLLNCPTQNAQVQNTM